MLEPFRTCGCEHSVSREGSQEANPAPTVLGCQTVSTSGQMILGTEAVVFI